MKSIIPIVLAAAVLLSVLTGCGRKNKNEDNMIPSATPAETTMPDETTPGVENGADVGSAADRAETGVNDAVNGVEEGVDDMIDGVENGVNDLLGDDGLINGDMDDGRVEDDDARTDDKALSTPQAR